MMASPLQSDGSGGPLSIAVVGAAGRTGRLVVEQALDRGHRVRALARRPDAIGLRDPGLELVAVDVRDAEALGDAVAGCDALISTLGTGTSGKPTDLYSQGATNELKAAANNDIRKLEVISAAPAGPRDEQPWFARRIAFPVLDRLFGGAYQDMQKMEAALQGSDVDWLVLRPPRLVDRRARGTYRIDTNPLPNARSITYPDLATALLDLLDRPDLRRQAFYVAN